MRQLELIRKMSEIPIKKEPGGMGDLPLPELLGNKLLAFWSRCDDSEHSRLFACSPVNAAFVYSSGSNLDYSYPIFGVVFQRT